MNIYSNPIKLYEYLESKLPIVSTNIPSVISCSKDFPIYIANDANMFSLYIKRLTKKGEVFFDNHKLFLLIKYNSILTKIHQTNKIITRLIETNK